MAIIKGKWYWKDGVSYEDLDSEIEGVADFTSGGVAFSGIMASPSGVVYFYAEELEGGVTELTNPHRDTVYQCMDFGETGQTINDGFYAWFTANAMRDVNMPTISLAGSVLAISEVVDAMGYYIYVNGSYEHMTMERSVDLSTVITSSVPRSYTITVTAYFDNDIDPIWESDPSEPVTYTVEAPAGTTISLEGTMLTIAPLSGAMGYRLYVDGEYLYETEEAEIDLSSLLDGYASGSYVLTVAAYFDNDVDPIYESKPSNAVIYTIGADTSDKYTVTREWLEGVAGAIREQKGTEDLIDGADFESEIRSIPKAEYDSLNTPVLSIPKSDVLQIEDENGTFGDTLDIYVDGAYLTSITRSGPSMTFDLTTLLLEAGNSYSITATLKGKSFLDSGMSGAVVYTPAGELVFTSNGDGTCYVSGPGSYSNTVLEIPSVSPDGDVVTAIGEEAFSYNAVFTKIVLPSTVKELKKMCFFNMLNCTEIVLNEGLETIGQQACSYMGVVHFDFPSTLRTVGNYAFDGSLIEKLVVPPQVTSWGKGCFRDTFKVVEIVFPEGMTTIPESFCGTMTKTATNLKRVYIPKSVTNMGNKSFYKQLGIVDVYYGGTEEEWASVDPGTLNNSAIYDATIHYNYSFSSEESHVLSGTFVKNENVTYPDITMRMDASFTSNGDAFTAIVIMSELDAQLPCKIFYLGEAAVDVASSEAYRTLTFTETASVNATFYTWFTNNYTAITA